MSHSEGVAMAAGRPTKYDAKYHVPWARGLAMRGATIQQIAEDMDVATSTIYEWMERHAEFSDALNEGRIQTDLRVERSLYERAMGGKSREVKKVVEVIDGQPVVKRIEETEKEMPPDVTACIFWLKNRNPKLWRDKQDIQMAEADDAAIKKWIGALGLGSGNARV